MRPGLTCVADAGGEFGLDPTVDVCRKLEGCDLDRGDPDYCRLCGPCPYGEGDCDDDRECQAGLTCLDDVGEIFGLPGVTDVCAFRENGFCPLPPGHPNYCEVCGPCSAGEGNCKASGQCTGVLTCFEDVGAQLGFSAGTNVCLVSSPESCPFEPGHPDYCRVCGVCEEGEGDCDADRECGAGLSCVDGAGVAPGTGERIDVCQAVGGALEAPRKLKAKALSSSRVRLRWRDKSKSESGFHIEVSRAGGAFERIASTSANKRKLIVSGLESGATYTFRVQAFGDAGLSPYSNERTITLP